MKIFPTNAAKSENDNCFATGSLVFFEHNSVGHIGCITDYRKNKYVILDHKELQTELPAIRLIPIFGKIPSNLSTNIQKADYLNTFFAESNSKARTLNLETTWEKLVQAQNPQAEKAYDYKEICKIHFGNLEPRNILTLLLALIFDSVYFKRSKDSFAPRPFNIVQNLQASRQKAQEKKDAQDRSINAFKQKLANPSFKLPAPARLSISLLEDLAAGIEDNERIKEAKEFLEFTLNQLKLEISGYPHQKAFELLLRLGHFTQNTNLALIRYKPKIIFSEESLTQAENLDPSKNHLIDESFLIHDFSKLDCFTIDDASTKDMDDAISLEQLPDGGFRLGVHISDVAGAILVDSPVDKDALQRATSIYCPEQTINMLPEMLCNDKLSLVAGQTRGVLSCIFEIGQDFKINKSEIKAGKVKINKRYTYPEVDQILESDDNSLEQTMLNNLYNITSQLESERIAKGALRVHKHDVNVIADATSGEIELVPYDESSPARNLIGELMVQANKTFAEFAAYHDMPFIFRGQEAPHDSNSDEGSSDNNQKKNDGPLKLKRSTLSFSPEPHAALGLNAYAQVTSPIRRYSDLINQRQILYFLANNKAFYSVDDLDKLLQVLEPAMNVAKSVAYESKRYWLMRYLEPIAKEGKTIEATVFRTDLKRPVVELDHVFLRTSIELKINVKRGDRLKLKIVNIYPKDDYIKLVLSTN